MMLVHLTAVALFTFIYDARLRSLLSATAISLVTVLLATRLFWESKDDLAQAFQYGGVTGLIIGQVTWGLNYWRLSGLQGGLCLLLVFYVVVGLIQQFQQGQLDDDLNGRRIILEYGGVAIVTLSLVALAAP
jgi:hypothetical protein